MSKMMEMIISIIFIKLWCDESEWVTTEVVQVLSHVVLNLTLIVALFMVWRAAILWCFHSALWTHTHTHTHTYTHTDTSLQLSWTDASDGQFQSCAVGMPPDLRPIGAVKRVMKKFNRWQQSAKSSFEPITDSGERNSEFLMWKKSKYCLVHRLI